MNFDDFAGLLGHPGIPRNTPEYPGYLGLPRGTPECRGVPWGSPGYPWVPRGTPGAPGCPGVTRGYNLGVTPEYPGVPRGTPEHPGVTQGTPGFPGVPQGTPGYPGVTRVIPGCPGAPWGTLGYSGAPRGISGYFGVLRCGTQIFLFFAGCFPGSSWSLLGPSGASWEARGHPFGVAWDLYRSSLGPYGDSPRVFFAFHVARVAQMVVESKSSRQGRCRMLLRASWCTLHCDNTCVERAGGYIYIYISK
jgi:hypothetical protein